MKEQPCLRRRQQMRGGDDCGSEVLCLCYRGASKETDNKKQKAKSSSSRRSVAGSIRAGVGVAGERVLDRSSLWQDFPIGDRQTC